MYKVIGVGEHGKYFDEGAYAQVIGYVRSHALLFGALNIRNYCEAAEEMLQNAKRWGKNSGKRVRHSVLSFGYDDPITPIQAASMADSILAFYEEYQIVYAVHHNKEGMHIHFVMNQVSLQGSRYRGQKADYYAFRQWMQMVTGRIIDLTT